MFGVLTRTKVGELKKIYRCSGKTERASLDVVSVCALCCRFECDKRRGRSDSRDCVPFEACNACRPQ